MTNFDRAPISAIGKMIEPIVPAALEARGAEGDPTESATKQNVRRVVRFLVLS